MPVQIKPNKQTNTTICIVRKGKYVENLYRGKLPQLYDLTFCWHTAYMALVHLTSSFDMPNHCRSNESTFLYCQSNGSTFRTGIKELLRSESGFRFKMNRTNFSWLEGPLKGSKVLKRTYFHILLGPHKLQMLNCSPDIEFCNVFRLQHNLEDNFRMKYTMLWNHSIYIRTVSP